jgi:hypothetical protein
MAKLIRHVLREWHFVGGRFEENKGWLDFDILPELQAYKRLLVETAKEEWRRRNPDRERLPRGFEENIHLGFHEVREGSCSVPVERLVEEEENTFLEPRYESDEVAEAARILDATLIAARNDAPFPERLPAHVIPMFEDWGKTLAPGEGIELDGRDMAGPRPRFDESIRQRLLSARRESYEDTLDLVGEVRAADVKAGEDGAFAVLLEDGSRVSGSFSAGQEQTITKALYERNQLRLRIEGLGEFEPNGKLRRIVSIDRMEEHPLGETPFDPEAPPIWEVIAAIGKSVPEEDWRKVPSDLAANLDHYLYGSGKEGEQ